MRLRCGTVQAVANSGILEFASRIRSHRWVGYLLAFAASALALVIRLQLGEALSGSPFLTFFGAVLIVSFLGGLYPALLTAGISAVLAKYFLIPPVGTLALEFPSGAIALSFYFLITGTLIALIHALSVAHERQVETDKLLRDRAMFESEQQFRILVQGVRDYAIYRLDPDGIVASWNSGAELIKGYSSDEIVGEHFSRFYTASDQASGEPERALATALREGKYERDARRVRKDGTLFWASVVIDPIFDENGEHVGFAKITRDISESKQREVELEQARVAIAQAQKLQTLGEFTGGIAHDFNNLMTVIVGATDFLLKHDNLNPDKQRKYLESIAQTADRATNLTNHLLAFARRQSLRPEVTDLGVRVDAFAEMITRLLGSKITVIVENEARRPTVEVDVAQLDTALLNAALNARDAMPNGGKLILATHDCELGGEPAICLSMQDTGEGISPEKLGQVFEPFFTTKATGKGTGLGLSQIHGFAAQSGGEATIESETGIGTTLRITLPRTDKPIAPKSTVRPAEPLPRGLRVLLVEDNRHVQEFAAKLLKDLGCKVLAVDDGIEALEKIRGEGFDLVFSDVMMPRMGGLELANIIRQEHRPTPVVLTTGYSDDLIGAFPEETVIVRKPYDLTALQRAISTALGRAS